MRRLAQTLATSQGAAPGVMRTVQVVSVDGNKLTVQFADGVVSVGGVRYLSSYAPQVGDNALAWCQGKTVLVLGCLA